VTIVKTAFRTSRTYSPSRHRSSRQRSDSVSSRLGHAIPNALSRERPLSWSRYGVPTTASQHHQQRAPVPREISDAELENRIPRYFQGRWRFTTPMTLRWATRSGGGRFLPRVECIPRSMCCRTSDKSVTWFVSNDGALGATTRFDSRRDRFCPRFVKRRELSRPNLPSTDQWNLPCSPDLKAFQRSRWRCRSFLFTPRNFAATLCFSAPLRIERLCSWPRSLTHPCRSKGGECLSEHVRPTLRPPFTLSGAVPYFALLWARVLPTDFCNSSRRTGTPYRTVILARRAVWWLRVRCRDCQLPDNPTASHAIPRGESFVDLCPFD